jgi:hypothetical protein
MSKKEEDGEFVVVIISDDWCHLDTFQIEDEIHVPAHIDPEELYEYWVKEVRKAWEEEGEWRIADEFEVDLKADKWVIEQAKDLELGDVIRAHLFCIRETPETPDEDTMNVVVLLTLQ